MAEESGIGHGPSKSFWRIHDRVVLLRLGPMTLVSFGLWVALAWFLGGALALARLAQAGLLVPWLVPFLSIGIPVLAILGSRALEIAVNFRAYAAAPGRKLPETGFAFQGALILCTLALLFLAPAKGLPVLRLLDALALALPLGHAFGRMGCFAYGCCHGLPTRSRLAVRYVDPNSKPVWKEGLSGVPLHPTQIYSALGNLALFLALNGMAQTGTLGEGTLAATYLLLNSTGRFVTEFLRWPIPAGRRVKPFQWVSVGLFAAGLAMFAFSLQSPSFDFSLARGFEGWLAVAASHFGTLAAGSAVLFLGFGVHGHRVGRYFG